MLHPKEPWTRFPNAAEKLEFMKRIHLAAPTDIFPKTLTYFGGYVKEPIDCILLGFVSESTLVIQIAGEDHCINVDCLLEMQTGMRAASIPEEYVVLDVETTGFNHKKDEIIEIAAVRYRNGVEGNSFSSLVNPGCVIPLEIEALTGISNADVKGAPTFDAILPELLSILGDCPIVAHNAPFDMSFLSDALQTRGQVLRNKSIDTLPLVRKAFPGLPSYKLDELKAILPLSERPSHRALPDVYMTAELFSLCNSELRRSQMKKFREGAASDENESSFIPSEKKPKSARSRYMEFQTRPKPSEIVSTGEQIDKQCPLYGKKLVFTGELSMNRVEAMQIAVNSGAIIRTDVSRKTDYLIVGMQDKALVGDDGMSSKEEKAYALNAEGKASIRIIDEAEFLRLAQERDADYE